MERFFLLKKKFALDFCIVYDFSIELIYIFASWPYSQYDAKIYFFINFKNITKIILLPMNIF